MFKDRIQRPIGPVMHLLEPRVLMSAQLVRDVDPALPLTAPEDLVAVGNTLYFTTDYEGAYELLRSVDPATGRSVVVRGLPALASNLTGVGGTLYFTTADPVTGRLWKSQGRKVGTLPITTIPDGPASLTDVNGTLFFAAGSETEFVGR